MSESKESQRRGGGGEERANNAPVSLPQGEQKHIHSSGADVKRTSVLVGMREGKTGGNGERGTQEEDEEGGR